MSRLKWWTALLVGAGTGGPATVEQTTPGSKAPAALVASFDGLGAGFVGPEGSSAQRNPSDNTLAVGPDRIVQIVNTRLAIFTKSGQPVFGPVATNTVFRDFGGPCETRNNGDAVVRYDQLAGRWLIVMPVFSRGLLRNAPQPGPAVGLLGTRHSALGPPVLKAECRVPRAECRAPTPYAMRSVPVVIPWARTIATSSSGRSFPTIRGPPSGPTATTFRPAPATT